MLNASEIVGALGGTNAAARFFRVTPPSVSEWVKKGEIPQDKLIRKAATLEKRLPDRFDRRAQWPEEFQDIWPELEPRPRVQESGGTLPAGLSGDRRELGAQLAGPTAAGASDKPLELVDRRVADRPFAHEERRRLSRWED